MCLRAYWSSAVEVLVGRMAVAVVVLVDMLTPRTFSNRALRTTWWLVQVLPVSQPRRMFQQLAI